MRRFIIITGLTLTVLFSAILCASAATIIDWGTCGENAIWKIDNEGTLTISGEGLMQDNDAMASHQKNIKRVVIGEGITNIDRFVFGRCENLCEVSISNTVEFIGMGAFNRCTSLKSLTIPKSVTQLYNDICPNCPNLKDIYYLGTKEEWAQVDQINSKLSDDITIHCTMSDYTYRFLDYDGTVIQSVTAPYGTTIENTPDAPQREQDICKYTFADWDGYTEGMELTEDIDFIAQYNGEPIANKTKIIGDKYVSIGDTDIIEGVYFTSDKQIKTAVFEIQYPSYLQLKSVSAKDFLIAQKSGEPQTSGNITTVRVLCQYSSNESADANTLVNPFDLVFDVSQNTSSANGTISITNAMLNTAEGGNYTPDILDGQSLIVNPCLVDALEIVGDSEIYGTHKYTAVITPEYATNKNVIWSVDDEDIAEISQSGLLTAKKKGTVTVIAKSADGNASDRKKITVHAYATVSNITSDIGSWDKTFSSNNRNYTVYVDGTAQSVSFMVSAPVGTVYANDNLMLSGFPQEFSLTGEQTEIVFDVKDVADYEDGTYTVTVVRGGKYIELNNTPQYSNGSYVFNAVSCNIDLSPNDKFIAVVYDDKGCLLGIGNANAINSTITVPCDTQACSYKVFLWDKLGGMKPICGSIEGLF